MAYAKYHGVRLVIFIDDILIIGHNHKVETEVIVDASPVVLDAMLTQKKRDGDRPITYLVLLNRVTVRRNEKHWLFAGRASFYVCTWLEHGSRS